MAQTIFAITIFVSAFLLFLVQFLISKLILPRLGGTPQVWNTCSFFFQSALLLGYAYTHTVTTRLKFRQQLMLHGALLAIPVLMMLLFPIYSSVQQWSPPAGSNPIFNTLGLLAMIIGVPFFVVSTTAPLLQKWFAYSGHPSAKDPYFLYAISNIGSLLSLLAYPFVIEPLMKLPDQSYLWFGGFVVLGLCVLACAFMISKLAPPDEQILASEAVVEAPPPPVETPAPVAAPSVPATTAIKSGPATGARGIQRKKGAKVPGKPEEETAAVKETSPSIVKGAMAEMTWWRRIRWVLLAFVPSSLMLGVTSYISTDMSPFPLVWAIPLALYLLSFILVYDKYVQWTSKRVGGAYTLQQMMVYVGQPIGLIILIYIVMKGGFDPVASTFMVMLGFFANALACHGELAEDRPGTKHLTEYFLLMSFGGMLGGMFNGIIAPVVFQTGVLEFYIVIVVAAMVRPTYVPSGWFDELILQSFPGFRDWVRNQGDEMAKSMGRPTPHSTYLFSFFLDILFGVFILSISYWLRMRYYQYGWVISFLEFAGFKSKDPRELPTGFEFARTALTMGPPLVFAFFFAGRPLRMGLAIAGIMLGALYLTSGDRDILESRRTYFGLLRVMKEDETPKDPEEQASFIKKLIKGKEGKDFMPRFPYTYLMHGTTYHGRNYTYEPEDAPYTADMTRLATTYYHRYGPVGVVMERYNWFPGKQNSFTSDVRLPASLVGHLIASSQAGSLPFEALANVWTEPPFATIGLGTGTMASYARTYQHMTYYEIDDVIREFSLPEGDRPARFTYLQNAIRRGVNLEVVMGDARLSLQPERTAENDKDKIVHAGEAGNYKNTYVYAADFAKFTDQKERHYAQAPYENVNVGPRQERLSTPERKSLWLRDGFYKVIVVDAFSSDAIPIHLVTREAIKIYLDKLTEDGVLCVHTSNRHMDLVRPVARIAKELKVECKVGKDRVDGMWREYYMGHFSSEYVMLYRDVKVGIQGKEYANWGAYLDECFETHEKLYNEYVKVNEERDPRHWRAPKDRPILTSRVEWYDPYKEQSFPMRGGGRYVWHKAVTMQDPLWTDDYSHILSVVRFHWPWQ